MLESDFQPGFPGELVPASFTLRTESGDLRTSKGLAFVPSALPPFLNRSQLLGELYDELDGAKTALLKLEGRVTSLPSATVLLSSIQWREAQASSKIENTVASLTQLALFVDTPEAGDSTVAEVARNRLAIEHGFNSPLPISNRLICEMHRILVRSPKNRPGQYRDVQVMIGDENRGLPEARFVPPPPDRVSEAMKAWERFCNPDAIESGSRLRFPQIVEMAMAHYQFETIHPFSDGNGRLGRAIVNISAVKSGLIAQPVCNVSEWIHEHRDEYYEGLLRVSTHGAWAAWIRFFCRAVREQAIADLKRADRLAALYDRYYAELSGQRSAQPLRLLDYVFAKLSLSIPEAAEKLGMTYGAAKPHVERLVDVGVLKLAAQSALGRPRQVPMEEGKRLRDKLYIAQGVIDAIRGDGED